MVLQKEFGSRTCHQSGVVMSGMKNGRAVGEDTSLAGTRVPRGDNSTPTKTKKKTQRFKDNAKWLS